VSERIAFSAKEAADYLGMGLATFHKWRKRQKMQIRLDGTRFYSKPRIDAIVFPDSRHNSAAISLQKNSVGLIKGRNHETRIGRRKLSS
jgi:hypothetical protein